MTSLASSLQRSVAEHGGRAAVRLDDVVLTYTDLDDLTARVAGALHERGIGLGERVGIMLPNVPAFPVVYYGVLRAGCTVVPMNPLLKAREVEHHLGDSAARLAFVWTSLPRRPRQAPARQAWISSPSSRTSSTRSLSGPLDPT